MLIRLTKSHGNTWGRPDAREVFNGTLEITKGLKEEELIDLLNDITKGSYWWEKVITTKESKDV